MAQWGRGAARAVPGAVASTTFGKRSVILALAAFAAGATAIAIMVAMPSDASERAQNIGTGFFAFIFLLAGPIAHVTGLVFGVKALQRLNDSRLLGVVGIVLNGLSLVIGLFLLWAATKSIGAFR